MSSQGAHYKTAEGEQHHQRVMRLKMNWYAANITKYAERAPHKGQLTEDLIKVIDYAVMWLSHEHVLMPDQRDRLKEIMGKVMLMPPSPWTTPAINPRNLISDQMEDEGSEATSRYTGQK